MENPEIALIGTGDISHHHVPALREAGLDVRAVASMNPASKTLGAFADEFDIPEMYRGESWRAMVEDNRWDGIVIATHIDGTPEALAHSLKVDVPILVEKPVAWTSEEIHALRDSAHDRVIVGYNRRFYKPVLEASAFLSENRPVTATIELPGTSISIRNFLDMSSHGIDLIRFLFGEPTLLDTHELIDDGELRGFTATMRSTEGDLITVIGNWGAPSNMGINLDYRDTRFQIEPYEQAKQYRGFEVTDPTDEIPVRQYHPDEVDTVNLAPVDHEFKPGFFQQASAFSDLVAGSEPPEIVATLSDAEKTIALCEQLLPKHLPAEVS